MIQFDYEAILERLQKNLKEKLGENSDLLFFSTNQRILEAIAEELQEQMRYDEYLTMESKWETSQNLSSILSQIGFFNYTPHRMIGAVGDVIVSTSPTFNTTYPNRVLIPKYTEFSSEDLTFCATQNVELLNNMEKIAVPVVQGFYREYVFEITYAYSPLELVDFEVSIENPKIENYVFDLTVNGILWNRVDHFGYSEGPDDNVYELRNKTDFSGITLQFGDGIQSKKVEYGDVIRFRCVETEGNKGEVLRTNAVNTVVPIIRDSLNNRVTVYCKNENEIASGDSYESIESIKYNAPRALRLSSRLISKTDYQAFLLSEGYADKVTVWGETEENVDAGMPVGTFIPYSENVIKIAGININSEGMGVPLSETEQMHIRDAIAPIKSLTDIIQFHDPKITYLRFTPEVGYSADKYTPDEVINAVTNILMDTYAISNQNRRFKESLYYSQFYELINSLPEVVWHQTELTMIQYPEWSIDPLDGEIIPYTFQIELNHSHIFPGTVKLFIRNIDINLPEGHFYKDWYLISEFDENGNFVPEIIPEWDDEPEYTIPDADGSTTFSFSFPNPTDFFSYLRGKFMEDSEVLDPEAVDITIENGVSFSATSNYQLKIEFDGGTVAGSDVLRTNVIPNRRYQLFSCEYVETARLVPIQAEEEMGY